MKLGIGTKRNLWLILIIIIVVCATWIAATFLVDSVNVAIAKRNEYLQAEQALSQARQDKQELQVLIDMYKEDPSVFMEYVARKSGYIKDGEIIFDLDGK